MDGDAASPKSPSPGRGHVLSTSPSEGDLQPPPSPARGSKAGSCGELAGVESLNPCERRRRLSALRELGIRSGNEAQAEVRGFLRSQPRLELLNQPSLSLKNPQLAHNPRRFLQFLKARGTRLHLGVAFCWAGFRRVFPASGGGFCKARLIINRQLQPFAGGRKGWGRGRGWTSGQAEVFWEQLLDVFGVLRMV